MCSAVTESTRAREKRNSAGASVYKENFLFLSASIGPRNISVYASTIRLTWKRSLTIFSRLFIISAKGEKKENGKKNYLVIDEIVLKYDVLKPFVFVCDNTIRFTIYTFRRYYFLTNFD